MGPTSLPSVGAQARRKTDGILGEVYATDPLHNLLSVRWATVPGSYGHQDCTADQFARAWELTGIQLQPPRETHAALGVIAALVLIAFSALLVHNARSFYVTYAPFRTTAAEGTRILNSAQDLHKKYGMLAASTCASGADEYIRSITDHRFHWNNPNALEPRFNKFSSKLIAPGVLTMVTEKPEVSNGFGVFAPITIYCNYDTQNNEALSYSTDDPTR